MRRVGLSIGVWLLAVAAAGAQAPQAPSGATPAERESLPSAQQRSAQPQQPSLLVLRTHAQGVDPVVARFVDRQLGRTAQVLGHAPVGAGDTAQAELGAVSLQELWNLMHLAGAPRAVSALVWAQDGLYRVRVRLASADGLGPFVAEDSADAPGLEARVDGLLRQALDQLAAAQGLPSGNEPQPSHAPPQAESSDDVSTAGQVQVQPDPQPATPAGPRVVPVQRDPFRAATPSPPDPDAWRFEGSNAQLRLLRVGVRSDAAFGVGEHRFFNMLLGVRALYRFDTDTALGGYLGYVNVKTRGGRGAASLLGMALEHRVPVQGHPVSVPLRMMLGYLAKNGSVLRLSSGLAYALDAHTSISIDLLSPTFWVTPDRTLLSLDLGLELSADF